MDGEFVLRLPLASHEAENVDSRITLPIKPHGTGFALGELSSSEEDIGDEGEDEEEDDEDDDEVQEVNQSQTTLTLPIIAQNAEVASGVVEQPAELAQQEQCGEEGEEENLSEPEREDAQRRKKGHVQQVEEDTSGLRRSGRKRTTRLDPNEFELSFSGSSDPDSDDSGRKSKKRKRGKKIRDAPTQDFKITIEKPKEGRTGPVKAETSIVTVPTKQGVAPKTDKAPTGQKSQQPPKPTITKSANKTPAPTETVDDVPRVGRKKMSIRQRLVKKLGIKT